MPVTRLIASSKNTGSFGHTSHIFVAESGKVYNVLRVEGPWQSHKWTKGELIEFPSKPPATEANKAVPDFESQGAEIVTEIKSVSTGELTHIFSTHYNQQEAEAAAERAEARKKFLSNNRPTKRDREALNSLKLKGVEWGKEPERPKGYAIPLRRRDRIIDFLNSESGWEKRGNDQNYDGETWLFAFNVKLHNLNLDFDYLLKAHKKAAGITDDEQNDLNNPAYVEACRDKFKEMQGNLFEYGVDDARQEVRDSYEETYSGHRITSEIMFYGREGGWLVLTQFNGHQLTVDTDFEEWNDKDVFLLYELIVMLADDLKGRSPEDRVERCAAWALFENICHDVEVPQPVA